MDGIELTFEDETAKAIAQEAAKRKTGARALRSIVEEIMLDFMYEAPSREDLKSVRITPEMVKQKTVLKVVEPTEKTPELSSVQPKAVS